LSSAYLSSDSLLEIKQLLDRNNDTFVQVAESTRSLREDNPGIDVPTSIYGKEDEAESIRSTIVSVVAPSDQEFDFDDLIVSSKVYRKFLAEAMAKGNLDNLGASEIVEGDLIDLSDGSILTARQGQLEEVATDSAARLLGGLEISNVGEVTRKDTVSCKN
jgi:hypothetical protein